MAKSNVPILEGEYITNPDTGHRLFSNVWNNSSGSPKAIVFIVHGYGEHILHYEDSVIPALTSCGFIVYGHDHFGHGHSDGTIADLEVFDNFSLDLIYHIKQRIPLHPDLPIFLVAHSLGGIIALEAVMKETNCIQGIVLIAPAITVSREAASPVLITMAQFLSKICPRATITTLDSTKITRDQDIVKRYKEDPLIHASICAKFAIQALEAQLNLEKQLPEITIPFLVLHGTNDGITDISGAHLLMERTSSEDKTLKEFPGAYHQIHHEPDGVAEEAMKLMSDWMIARI